MNVKIIKWVLKVYGLVFGFLLIFGLGVYFNSNGTDFLGIYLSMFVGVIASIGCYRHYKKLKDNGYWEE